MAVPQILIDASNGASDYGNKFGEPLVAGYTRTFGLRMPSGDRREWIKPIMFRQVLPRYAWGCLGAPFGGLPWSCVLLNNLSEGCFCQAMCAAL